MTAEQYPGRISACIVLPTGDRIPLAAVRTDEIDGRGCRVYDLRPEGDEAWLPVSEDDFRAGRARVQIEMVPGRASIRFRFGRQAHA
jgi:hypothetical protein